MRLSEEIQRLPEAWRFCLVQADGRNKRAYEKKWPTLDLNADAIEKKLSHSRTKATMVGVVLGEASQGLMAIDHDGHGAAQVVREVLGLDKLPETATITSRKPGRFCCFYRVPAEQWEGLRKVVIKSQVEGEQLELRWGSLSVGHQQVVAGIHPETERPYEWIRHPSEGIAELPPGILKIWRERINPQSEPAPLLPPTPIKESPAIDFLPPEVVLSREHREMIRQGVGKGGRDNAGIKLACDLIGVDNWARANGLRLQERVRGLFEEFCARCVPPLPDRDRDRIWASAESRNPTPCLSPDKLETNVAAWRRRQVKSAADPTVPIPPERRVERDRLPFQFLGFNKDLYFYQPEQSKQVVPISAGSHAQKGRLMTLAPRHWWMAEFPKPGKGEPGIDWEQAMSWLFEMQHLQGVYDPRRLRGRGCWIDESRVIIHLGDRLLVDGNHVEIGEVESRSIYEQSARIPAPDLEHPLTLAESREILNTAQLCRWEHPAAAVMLAGWVVLAPICGALSWRSHCWIVGGAGSGKSTILADFTKPLLGDMETSVLGASTEAGLRQFLGSDAIPVLMDEAEQAQARDEERLQSIMELARASSSETGAKTLKGTASGTGQEFLIRSMFLLSSITSSLKQGSDKSRFALLHLQNPANDTQEDQQRFGRQWETLRRKLLEITPEHGRRLIARTIARLPVLLREVELFSDIAAELFGSRRAGDQFGFLMAGAFSLVSDDEATLETATQFIGQYHWEDFLEPAKAGADHERCLSRIMEFKVRTGALGEPEVPVGELVEICLDRSLNRDIDQTLADKLLQRLGVKVKDGQILISGNHTSIGRVLERTPWSNDWRTVLKQVPGAELTSSTYFRGGHQSRAIAIPAGAVVKTDF